MQPAEASEGELGHHLEHPRGLFFFFFPLSLFPPLFQDFPLEVITERNLTRPGGGGERFAGGAEQEQKPRERC